MTVKNTGARQQLIRAGIREISEHGLQNLSMRRIAAECGLSCAAPYKHFKDKEDFIAGIVAYIGEMWHARQVAILDACEGGMKEKIVAVSVGYVRFLVENPQYRSIIMIKYPEFDRIHDNLRGRMTELSQHIVEEYCDSVGMPEDMRRRKLYVVRSLIYGAALMFDNGEMPYDDEHMQYVEYSIEREFVLP